MEFTAPTKLSDGRYVVSTIGDCGLFTIRDCSVTPSEDEWSLSLPSTQMISDIDSQIVDLAVKNSETWFGREMSRDTLSTYYQYSLDNGCLQASLSVNSKGRVSTVIFDETKSVVKDVAPGAQCAALVKLDGLWFLKRTFGPVWKIVQLRVKKPVQPVQCLIVDSDSE
jgi:hypothetical protein